MTTAQGPRPPRGPAPGEGVPGVPRSAAALCAVGAFLISGIGLTLWRSWGREYPVTPWLGVLPLVLVAVLVLVSGWRVRRSVRSPGPRTELPSPQWARGALVAAQACALGGAALVGWFLAHAAVHVPTLDVPSVQDLVWRALVSALAAAVVSVCGFVAQAWCRLPPVDDEEEERRRRGGDGGGLAYG